MMSIPSKGQPPASSHIGITKSHTTNGWSRRDRPCDACRRRKSRCIIPENAETCVMCQSRDEACTFIEVPQKRKKRRVEDEASPDVMKARSPESERSSIITKPPISDYDALPESLLKQTLGLQNRQHGQYLGQTSEYDARLINLSPFNGRGEHISTPGTLRRVSQHTHFVMKSESPAEVDEELANLDLVESIVAPHGRALVDLYFRIIHPSFPIMHKRVFLEKYYRSPTSYREFTPPILAAVYILALNWWNYSPDLVHLPKPDTHKLEKLMPSFLSNVLRRPKLSTVQAGLLLLQCPEGDSWALTGQMVAIAQNLGLHLDCTNWKIPEWERSLRKRLAWALYMQAKWGALIHGRPSLIHEDDWSVQAVEDRDFPETAEDDDDEEGSSDIETGRLTFVHMISLTQILSDILATFFSLRATAAFSNEREHAMTATLHQAKPIQLRLKEWHANLPRSLAISNTRARKLNPTGSLHLAYFTAEVTLHRAIIRFDSPSIDENIRSITRAAAQTRFISALEMVSKFEPAHLQCFWYFASRVNLAIIGTFGSLLWATSDNKEEAKYYKEKLAEYRWTLRVSSKAAEFMKFTVGMLDASPVFVKDSSSSSRSKETQRASQLISVSASGSGSGNTPNFPPALATYETTQSQYTSPLNQISPSAFSSTSNEQAWSAGTNTNTFDQPQQELDLPTRDNENAQTGVQWLQGLEFSGDDIQDWSLNQLYHFENFQVAEDIFASQRFVEKYDESGNHYAGF